MAGLHYAVGDYTVIMDDDFQNPPSEVRKLVEEIKTAMTWCMRVTKPNTTPFSKSRKPPAQLDGDARAGQTGGL